MSEAVSALAGIRASGMVSLAEAGPTGMITLRGDLAALGPVLEAETGLSVPGLRQVQAEGSRQLLWMSPDEGLLILPYAEAPAMAARLEAALSGHFATVALVSDARALINLTGAQVPDVLAKLCPVDFAGFAEGEIRRTRAAQVAVAIWRQGPQEWSLICFRSVAGYVWDSLVTVSKPGGEVGLYR